MEKYQAYLTVIARVLMAATFIWFGVMKLFVFGPTGTAQYLASVWHAPAPAAAAWIAIIVEIVGGLAILVGFKTRWAAAALALWCLFTAFGFHLPAGDPDNLGQFFKNITMAGGFIYILAYGPGSISIDRS
jgi:putative oxidoreductase